MYMLKPLAYSCSFDLELSSPNGLIQISQGSMLKNFNLRV